MRTISLFKMIVLALLTYQQINTKISLNPDNYYFFENLKDLYEQSIKKHAPCLILIDNDASETPGDTMLKALPLTLFAGINAAYFPIIVSRSILANLIYRADELLIFSEKKLKICRKNKI